MNILQINTSDTKGGAGKVAYCLQGELEKRGHKSTLLVSRKYSQDSNVMLIRPDNNLRRRILKKVTYYLANDLNFFPSEHILKMPEFKKADIIHCHNLHTNYFNLSTLKKISAVKPIIWTFHDMWPITAHCAHSFGGALKENGFFTCPSLDIYPPIAWHNERYLEKRKGEIYRNANFCIVTPSRWLADKVKQSILGDRPLSVIYNGINASIFKPYDKQEARHLLNLPQNKQIILIVAKRGQSNPWKGGDYVQDTIKAFTGNSRAFFVDLGGDANNSTNQGKVVSYVADQNILAKYYSAADILLYPSIADNCPLVVLEAMACGLPVVSFNTGGIPELVEHKINGYIAEYKNADDLKIGLDYLLNLPPQETEKMRRYSIEKIKTGFTVEKMTEQYMRLYEKIKAGS
ncbi:MAG TPA: glycosyltransferase [Candidatus Paceibacterota bacterium]